MKILQIAAIIFVSAISAKAGGIIGSWCNNSGCSSYLSVGSYSVYSWAGGAAAGDVMLATVRLKKYTGDTSGFDFCVKDVVSGVRHYLIQNVSGAFSGQISQVWTQPNSTTGFDVVPSVAGSTIIDIGFGELQIYNLTALGLA